MLVMYKIEEGRFRYCGFDAKCKCNIFIIIDKQTDSCIYCKSKFKIEPYDVKIQQKIACKEKTERFIIENISP